MPPAAPLTPTSDRRALPVGWGAPVALAVAVILWHFATQLRAYAVGDASDYPFHVDAVERWLNGGSLGINHCQFHILTAITHIVTGLSVRASAAGVTCVSAAAASVLVFSFLRLQDKSAPIGVIFGLASIAMVVGPINVLTTSLNAKVVSGYLHPNIYHNPTYLMVLPFGIAAVMLFLQWLKTEDRNANVLALGIGLLMAVSVYAKPIFAMVMVPAVLMTLIVESAMARKWSWPDWGAAASLCVPAVVALTWELLLYNQSGSGQDVNRIRIGFFAGTDDPVGLAMLKVGLSLLFPIAVGATAPRETWHDPTLRFAWIFAVIAISWSVFFYEDGSRRLHGNFGWGASIAAMFLFVSSLSFVRRNPAGYSAEAVAFLSALVGMHVVCGLFVWCLRAGGVPVL
jgi:hypothetical protein